MSPENWFIPSDISAFYACDCPCQIFPVMIFCSPLIQILSNYSYPMDLIACHKSMKLSLRIPLYPDYFLLEAIIFHAYNT